jgi:hypothetical protein
MKNKSVLTLAYYFKRGIMTSQLNGRQIDNAPIRGHNSRAIYDPSGAVSLRSLAGRDRR